MDSALQGERRRFPGGTRPSSSRERHTRASPQELSHRLPAPRTRPSLERPFSADTRRRQGPPGPSRGSVWFRTVLSFLASASQLQDEMEQPFPQERSFTRLRPPPRVVPVTGRAPSSSSVRGFRLHRSPSLCSTVLGHVPQTQSSDTKPSRWGPVCTPSADGSPARGPRPSRLFYCRAAASHCRSRSARPPRPLRSVLPSRLHRPGCPPSHPVPRHPSAGSQGTRHPSARSQGTAKRSR